MHVASCVANLGPLFFSIDRRTLPQMKKDRGQSQKLIKKEASIRACACKRMRSLPNRIVC